MFKNTYQKISFFLFNMMVVMFFFSIFLIYSCKSIFLEWTIGGAHINFSATILLDFMSTLFMSVVFCISSSVVWYSTSYMNSDKDAERFIYVVFGFVISMVLLILSPNMLSILLGWDGLGLISYCLVVYYPTKKSNSAGMLTVLSNRVGDVCVLLSFAWFGLLGDFNFSIWILSDALDTFFLPLLIMMAAMTKSAQIPFSAWLPAAMAAPTPVSALVHSSTLVTAGVYLLIRLSFLLESNWSPTLMLISVTTMFMSGVVAVFEYDLKKIIALSTLSQLGMMMFSISLGLYSIAFFHLITHALFKALLFLCAGIFIHGVGGSQDIRIYGGLAMNYPLVGVCLNLANFSLCGIPFLSGFYSKDLIVELACQSSWNFFIILIMFLSLGLTVMYSTRLVFTSFINFSGGYSFSIICDTDNILVFPVLLLTFMSLFSGPTLLWIFLPFPDLIFLPLMLKLMALFLISISLICTLSLSSFSFNLVNLYKKSFYFLGSMWFLPNLSGQISSFYPLLSGASLMKIMDQGWLEHSTNLMSTNLSVKLNQFFLIIQNNSLKTHFLIFILWTILLVWM